MVNGFPNRFGKKDREIEMIILNTINPMKSKKKVRLLGMIMQFSKKELDFFINGQCLGGMQNYVLIKK